MPSSTVITASEKYGATDQLGYKETFQYDEEGNLHSAATAGRQRITTSLVIRLESNDARWRKALYQHMEL